MRKHGGTPSRRDKHVTLAAISPPGVARGRFVGGQQSGLAGSKPPPLFTREASSCSSQGRRQGEPWGASPRLSAPTYLPTYINTMRRNDHRQQRNGTHANQADHEAAKTTANQQHRSCSGHLTVNRPHASRPTPNQPGVHGSKRERPPKGW